MTTVLKNPLSPGRYWVDVIGDKQIATFAGGVKGLNEAHPGLIRIVSSTYHTANETREYAESPDLTGMLVQLWEGLAGQIEDTPSRAWVLFEVTAPAIWDFDVMGTPTIAGETVKTEADTVQRPPPEEDPLDKLRKQLDEAAQTGKAILSGIATVGVSIGILWLISKFRRRK